MRSYLPGEWFGIVGERAVVILPPTEKPRVAALWELVDGGAGFDVTLDALISGGLRELSAFVLVSTGEGETRVVIRGPARAEFQVDGETVQLEGSNATTWVERSMVEVERMSIVLHDDEPRRRAAVVRRGRRPVPHLTARRGAGPRRARRDRRGARLRAGVPAAGGGVAETDEEDDAAGEYDDYADDEPERRVRGGRRGPVAGAAGLDSRSRRPCRPRHRPRRCCRRCPTAPLTEPMPEAPVPEYDHDGLTVAGAWQPPQAEPPGIPGQPPAPDVTVPVARLEISNGDEVDVDRAVVIGRAPEARRFNDTEQPRLVTVPSPHLEISSTHIEVRPGTGADHGSAVVTDLGSTNGTVLVQPGLGPEDLAPGVAVQLIPGAIIDLGDGVTIKVTSP